MASIREELIALAEKVKGSTGLTADDIASAIRLIADNYTDYTLPAATASALGGVKQAANQAEAAAAGESDDVVKLSDFNTLLAALKTAGIMVADATP